MIMLLLSLGIPALSYDRAYAATMNVTSYGANGGDASDDTTAIQNAINAASSGDTVYFPAGTYYINSSLLPKSGIKLNGASQSTAIIKFNGSAGSAMIYMPMSSSISNVEISNLTLDGNSDPEAYYGIEAHNGSGHNFHHLTIKNFVGTASLYGPFGIWFEGESGNAGSLKGVKNSTVADNTITNIGTSREWGSGIRMGWASKGNQILRNTISNTGRGGIFAHDGSTDSIIRNNTVSGSGMSTTPVGEGLAIEVWGESGKAIIEDNVVDHWISLDGADYTAVRRNTVRDTSGTIKFLGLEAASTSNNVFTDNTVDSGQQVGISISNDGDKQHNYWAYNTVQNMVQWGAQVQGDTGNANYQYFYNNTFQNTQNSNPNATYPDNDGHGFRFNGNTTYFTLDSNQIKNNGGLGIEVSPTTGIDKLSFVNNTITGNVSASISGYPSAAPDLEWSGNTVSGNGTNTQLTSRGFSNAKPTANFTSVTTATVGQTVSFTNTSSDPGGSIGFSLWDFGDGIPSTTTSPTYTYNQAGTYRVTLVVWDNLGRGARVEKNITVTSSTPSSSNLALGKTATADSTYSTEAAGKAVDGSLTTKWTSANTTGGHWLALDLGQSYSISRWVVKHAQAAGEASYFNTRDFKLQQSSDGTNWSDVDTVTGNTGSVTDRNVTAFTNRYVRLYVTTPTTASDNTARIYEFEVWGAAAAADANVALGKTATADSNYATEAASRTVDGSLTTKWASANTTGGHWLALDLGQSYSISRWVAKHAQAAGEASYFNTRDFKLQRSSDGISWVDVDTVTGNTGSVTDRTVTAFTSRYVRLYITTPTTGSDNTARIYEFEAWGH
ncbi:discoidin domain-containing protein [Cohnella sp. GCM10027633]|uniref:galactose-binding domain-containing protein n=1 Tax=unclassified Cohnella TaxID=2636738 RepID=UPI00362BFE2A